MIKQLSPEHSPRIIYTPDNSYVITYNNSTRYSNMTDTKSTKGKNVSGNAQPSREDISSGVSKAKSDNGKGSEGTKRTQDTRPAKDGPATSNVSTSDADIDMNISEVNKLKPKDGSTMTTTKQPKQQVPNDEGFQSAVEDNEMDSVEEYFNQMDDHPTTPTLDTQLKNRYGGSSYIPPPFNPNNLGSTFIKSNDKMYKELKKQQMDFQQETKSFQEETKNMFNDMMAKFSEMMTFMQMSKAESDAKIEELAKRTDESLKNKPDFSTIENITKTMDVQAVTKEDLSSLHTDLNNRISQNNEIVSQNQELVSMVNQRFNSSDRRINTLEQASTSNSQNYDKLSNDFDKFNKQLHNLNTQLTKYNNTFEKENKEVLSFVTKYSDEFKERIQSSTQDTKIRIADLETSANHQLVKTNVQLTKLESEFEFGYKMPKSLVLEPKEEEKIIHILSSRKHLGKYQYLVTYKNYKQEWVDSQVIDDNPHYAELLKDYQDFSYQQFLANVDNH